MSTKLFPPRSSAPRRFRLSLPLGSVAAGLVGLLVACAGELPPDLKGTNNGTGGQTQQGTGGAGPAGCDRAMTIISTKCNICHATASASFGNLDLISAGVASRLVGVATYANGECKGKGNLLDSGSNPATGVFIQKLNPNPSCGDQMPPGSPLQSDDIACLTAWAGTLTAGGK